MKTHHQSGPGYVYVLRAQDRLQGQPEDTILVNIGRSYDPKARLGTWGKGLPVKVDYATVMFIKAADAVACERWLHRLYESKKVRNEWFLLTLEDLNWLRSRWAHHPLIVEAEVAHRESEGLWREKKIEKAKRLSRVRRRRAGA